MLKLREMTLNEHEMRHFIDIYLKDGLSLIQSFLGCHPLQLNVHVGLDEVRVLIYVKKEITQARINDKRRHFLFPMYNLLVYAGFL